MARTWVLRAGELTGLGDDLFFLELPEVFGLLRGEQAPLDQVPGRRAVYDGISGAAVLSHAHPRALRPRSVGG